MNKCLLLFTLLCLPSIHIEGQITFNKQFTAGFPFLAITSVHPTDSCYYASSVNQEAVDGFLSVGNTFFKFDLQGNIQIQKSIGSPSKWYQTWRADLIPTENESFVTLGLTSQDGPTKGVIIKYDNQGDTIFTKEFLSPFYPDEFFIHAAAIRLTIDGELWILTGVNAIPGGSNVEVYLTQANEEGNITEEYLYENSVTDTPISLLTNQENNIIIGSQRSNIGQSGNNFFSQAHIFEVNELGEKIWEYLSPSNQLINYPTNLIPTPDGGLIAASGIGTELEVSSQTSYMLWFPYFFKLNADHELEWVKEFRGIQKSTDFNIRDMVAAQDGSGYVAISRITEKESTGEEVLGSWLMKVSPQGDSLWTRYYSVFDDLPSEPTPYDIKNTPDGGFIIAGNTSTNIDTSVLLRGWLLKVDEHGCLIPGCQGTDTSIKEEEQTSINLAIYPNPTSDFLNFELRGSKAKPNATFQIIDVQGRILKQIEAPEVWGTAVVPLDGWANGTYWLQYVENGVVVLSAGFVVQK